MNLKKINNPFGGLVYYKESTTSTMSDAKNLLDEEAIDGSLVIADYQTAGIGRIPSRKWFSEKNKNVMFTLIVSMDFVGHGYVTTPLRAGLALAKTIDKLSGTDSKVKWPNDILVNDKKISGVLCHTKKRKIMVGVGINVNQIDFDKSISNKTTSLSILTHNGFSQEMVISLFLENFYSVLKNDSWLEDLNRKLYRCGENVSFVQGNPETGKVINGIFKGLDVQGRVCIKDSSGDIQKYLSGEFI